MNDETIVIKDKRDSGYFIADNSLLANVKLTPTEKLVYFAICSFSGLSELKISHGTIAKRAAVSKRAVIRSIEKLEKEKLLVVTRDPDKGTVNEYTLTRQLVTKKTSTSDEQVHATSDDTSHNKDIVVNTNKIESETLIKHSKNWVAIQTFIESQKEKWAAPEYDYPNSTGRYDWKYLLNHGKCTPDLLVIAFYWREKEALTQGIFPYQFPTGDAAWKARGRDIKAAKHLAENYTLKKFKEAMDYTDNNAYDSKKLEYNFEWTLETVLKKIHNVDS